MQLIKMQISNVCDYTKPNYHSNIRLYQTFNISTEHCHYRSLCTYCCKILSILYHLTSGNGINEKKKEKALIKSSKYLLKSAVG